MYKKNQVVFWEGEPIHGIYFIHSGKAKVAKAGIDARQQIVRFAIAGDILGHRGFNVSNSYTVQAVAIEDSMLCFFKTESFTNLLKSSHKLTYHIMQFYAEELVKSENRMKNLAQMTVRERVAESLLLLEKVFGCNKNTIMVNLSRKEIGDIAGTNEEQVIRVFSSFRKDKLIHTQASKIDIIDKKGLQEIIASYQHS